MADQPDRPLLQRQYGRGAGAGGSGLASRARRALKQKRIGLDRSDPMSRTPDQVIATRVLLYAAAQQPLPGSTAVKAFLTGILCAILLSAAAAYVLDTEFQQTAQQHF